MHNLSGIVEKFDFVESTESWEFNEKLCILDLQIIQISKKRKIEFVESTNSWKFDGKSMNEPNYDNSMENCVQKM